MGKVDAAAVAAAAQLATSALLERARSCDLKRLWEPKTWNRLFQEVDDIVLTDSAAGYTTLIGVVIHNQLLVGASVGDSASVIDTNGKVYDLTARQHKNPPVGSGTATATPFASKLQTPWRLVLMSDGSGNMRVGES